MLGEHLAGALAKAEHDVEHAGRQPRLGEDLRQFQGRQRGIFRRFYDGDASARQHRRERLAHDHQGVIERRAIGDDADRRAQGVVQIGAFDGDHRVAARQRQSSKVPKKVRQPRQLGAGFVERTAVVEGLQPVQGFQIGLEGIREAIDQPCAGTDVHAAPGAAFERGPRAFHRAVDVIGGRIRNPRDHSAGGGIADIQHLALACFDLAAINKVAVDFDVDGRWFR